MQLRREFASGKLKVGLNKIKATRVPRRLSNNVVRTSQIPNRFWRIQVDPQWLAMLDSRCISGRNVYRIRNLYRPFLKVTTAIEEAWTMKCHLIIRTNYPHSKWKHIKISSTMSCHCHISLSKLNIKITKTWTLLSNNTNSTPLGYILNSSRAFIWMVVPLGFVGQFRI